MRLATAGDAQALDRLLRAAEPMVMNLAVRMLGRREDALDATQDVLMRVATHLPQFRGDSRFTTWAYRIAVNLLSDRLKSRQSLRARTFAELARDIEDGIDRFEARAEPSDTSTPEQRVAATELALVCTQGMLMALDPGQRLAYILAEVMGFDGEDGALIAGTTHEAFRQRLARARQRLRGFVAAHCGLVSDGARCRCDRQLRALEPAAIEWLSKQPLSGGRPVAVLHDALARQGIEDIRRLQSVALLFRAHPDQRLPGHAAKQLRARVAATAFGQGPPGQKASPP